MKEGLEKMKMGGILMVYVCYGDGVGQWYILYMDKAVAIVNSDRNKDIVRNMWTMRDKLIVYECVKLANRLGKVIDDCEGV